MRRLVPGIVAAVVSATASGQAGVPIARAAHLCPAPRFAVGAGGVLEDAGVAAAVRGLPALIAANREKGQHTSVAVAVVSGDRVLLSGAVGCANLAEERPATADTVYRIGSVTKVFQATWLMRLRDAGRLALDDPVGALVPPVWYLDPDGNPVSPTWRQLAAHTAGLPDQMPAGLSTVDDLFRWLERFRAPTRPGARYAYSDVGYVTLGQSLSRVTGIEYHRAMQEAVLGPLGMTSSTYERSNVPPDRLAVGYERRGPRPVIFPAGYGSPFPPSGNIYASANDMARFVSFAMAGDESPVLSLASRREMFEKVAPIGDGPDYVGIGWFMHPQGPDLVVAKNGGQPGFTTLVRMIPSLRLGVVVLINDSPKLVSAEHEGEAVLEQQIFDVLVPAIRAAPTPAAGAAVSRRSGAGG